MNITCETSYLKDALGKAKQATPARSTLEILGCVLLESIEDRLQITGSNLDNTIRVAIPATINAAGTVATRVDALLEYVALLPDAAVTLKLESNGQLSVKCGKSTRNFSCLPVADYPAIPEFTDEIQCTILSNILKEALGLTVFATSDVFGAVLASVLFQHSGNVVNFVGADDAMMSIYSAQVLETAEKPKECLVHSTAVKAFKAILPDNELPVSIGLNANMLYFEVDNATMTARLTEGKYPNWPRLLTIDRPNSFTFDRKEVLAALRRIMLVAKSGSGRIDVSITKDELNISALDSMSGSTTQEIIPIDLQGDEVRIFFNGQYMTEGLANIKSDKLTWNSATNRVPVLISGDDKHKFFCTPRDPSC